MEKAPAEEDKDQTSDPDPESEGEGAGDYADRQQTEEEMRGHGPADDENDAAD